VRVGRRQVWARMSALPAVKLFALYANLFHPSLTQILFPLDLFEHLQNQLPIR
jgi:hypothetical protein